ncbi:MAG: hypothetical protein NUV90_00625 [Candidatus Parcubacteria bacterium]|nr:hypothetical protein [Candidatus Parcubacteria bacterium]
MRTLKTIGIVSAAAAVLLSGTVAFAEGQTTSTSRENQKSENRAMTATTTWGEKGDYRAMMASSSQERMQAMRDAAQVRMTTLKEKMTKRVSDIEDKVKQEAAKNIAGQFENLNNVWTDKFMNQLDRYVTIVQKMQARSAIAASTGKDMTAANAAIQSALTALATAKADVVAQGAKTYVVDTSAFPTVSTTTPSGQTKILQEFRKSFQTLHTTLFKDLFALRDGVMKDARTAVQSALQALGQVPGVDEDNNNATSTEKKSNQ